MQVKRMGMQIATVCSIIALWSITLMSFSTILTDIPKSLHDIWQLYILLKYEHILLPISMFFTGLFIFTKENSLCKPFWSFQKMHRSRGQSLVSMALLAPAGRCSNYTIWMSLLIGNICAFVHVMDTFHRLWWCVSIVIIIANLAEF